MPKVFETKNYYIDTRIEVDYETNGMDFMSCLRQ